MTKITFVAILASLVSAGAASADSNGKSHISTDVVAWSSPTTVDQCAAKATAAIDGLKAGFAVTTHKDGAVGVETGWAIAIDCLQGHNANAAHVTTVSDQERADFDKIKVAVSKALGGTSDMYN